MPNDNDPRYRHLILEGVTTAEGFLSPPRRQQPRVVPERDRATHGNALLQQIQALDAAAPGAEEVLDLQVEFESFPDIELAFESLARERSGIEILNVRHEEGRTLATVLIPGGKLSHFERIIRDYLTEKRDSAGRARDNKRLLNAIHEIRKASLRALWTDQPDEFPTADGEPFWWEVWLPVLGDRVAVVAAFRLRAEAQEIRVAPGELEFPERTVLLAYATRAQMRSMVTRSSIAELRRAKETADFFDALPPQEQQDWLDDLLSRASYPGSPDDVPYVCLLDTGVNNGHPFISPALADEDLHTVEPGWGTADTHGHGTEMAGLALAGDLVTPLQDTGPVVIRHRLESVKLLSEPGSTGDDSRHHGYLTIEAVARPEITAPNRRRVFGMTITARDNRDRGRPSAWSAAVDRLACDATGQGANPRLLVLAAGNADQSKWADYPSSNETDGVHDPGQAWNALTVGACTDLVTITEPDTDSYVPIAQAGGLSPFSTTSLTWERSWPLKPDVVLEGGNVAKDSLSPVTMASLSLLTTHHRLSDRLFTTTTATSAATALAARMTAQVGAIYPELWPETVRALIVHSARWTKRMRQAFLPATGKPSKNDYQNLIRRCGFGVPNLDRALWSVANSLTMVVQEQLQPFKREGTRQPTLRDMHLHNLPWPNDVLESLGETIVELRVTLSYFIEPNPSARGVLSRYRYQSHGLRFDVKRPLESLGQFRSRVNAAARDEEEGTAVAETDPLWQVGAQARHRGSLHGDIWRGSAADLASRGALAVYPALGWWKTRPRLERYNRVARYALIVSITAPQVEVDLYSVVANQIGIPVTVEA